MVSRRSVGGRERDLGGDSAAGGFGRGCTSALGNCCGDFFPAAGGELWTSIVMAESPVAARLARSVAAGAQIFSNAPGKSDERAARGALREAIEAPR